MDEDREKIKKEIMAEFGLIAKLYEKVGMVIKESERISKNGHNDFHNYDYATESDIIEHVRKSMVESKIAITYKPVKTTLFEKTTDRGKKACLYTIDFEFRLIDVETGYSETFPWIGQGEDSSDKGVYKAYTGAQKYFIQKLFLIPTGDDPESDKGENGEKGKQSQTQGQKKEPGLSKPQTPPANTEKPKGDAVAFLAKFDEVKTIPEVEQIATESGKYKWADDEFKTLKNRYLNRKDEIAAIQAPAEDKAPAEPEKPSEPKQETPAPDQLTEYKKQIESAHRAGDMKLQIQIMKAGRAALGEQYVELVGFSNSLTVKKSA